MCFSAEASFSATILLGTVGALTLKNCSSKSQYLLAAIPLLFAFQQLAEGLVWLHLKYQIGSTPLFSMAQKIFLIFAFLIWPVWIPLSFLMVEQIPWRRIFIFIILVCGAGLSLLNLSYALKQEISVQVVNHSLQYLGQLPEQTLIYPLIVLLPCLLSSLRNVWIFGLLLTAGYFITDYFYEATLVSVWCFFAALVSLSVYKIIKDNQVSAEK